jgi:hypothetical protein
VLCTVVELDTAGVPIENAVSDVRVGTDAAGTSVDGHATTSVTITNSFDGVQLQPEVMHQSGGPRSADDQPGHQGEEQGGTQLDQRVARRDVDPAMTTATAQRNPRHHGNELARSELTAARGAVRRGRRDRLASGDAPERDVEERADARSEDAREHDDNRGRNGSQLRCGAGVSIVISVRPRGFRDESMRCRSGQSTDPTTGPASPW